MSMTDPIADLLTRIRNSQVAKHKTVDIPASRMKVAIVTILADEGFVDGFKMVDAEVQSSIRIALKYGTGGERAIHGLERVWRPGRRVYFGSDQVPEVLAGLGTSILTTSRGVMTGRAAVKAGVGGEVLCNIW